MASNSLTDLIRSFTVGVVVVTNPTAVSQSVRCPGIAAITVTAGSTVNLTNTATIAQLRAAFNLEDLVKGGQLNLLVAGTGEPAVNTTTRDAISAPTDGLRIYNTQTHQYEYYNNSAWGAVGSGGGSAYASIQIAAGAPITARTAISFSAEFTAVDGSPVAAVSNVALATVLGVHSFKLDAVGTGSTYSTHDGLKVLNTTAAINGTQQNSPLKVQEGQGFGTTAGTSQAVTCSTQVRPVQSTVPTGKMVWLWSIAGGAYTSVPAMTFNSIGQLVLANDAAGVAAPFVVNNTHTNATVNTVVSTLQRNGADVHYLGSDSADRPIMRAAAYGVDTISWGFGFKYAPANITSVVSGVSATLSHWVQGTVSGQTANTEVNSVLFDMNNTFTFLNSGAGASEFTNTQRAVYFKAPTYNFATATGSPQFTKIVTFAISGAPSVGGNVTAGGTKLAFEVESGDSKFGGNLLLNGTFQNLVSGNETTITPAAGANGALPATVQGYLSFKDSSGTTRKLAYY